MKRKVLIAVAAIFVCGANAAYAELSAKPLAVCGGASCNENSNCASPCNVCFPYPNGGPACVQWKEA